MTSNGEGIWKKILIALVPMAVAAGVAMVSLRSDVKHLEAEVSSKAARETVDLQYQAIIQRLDRIERKIDGP
jgi:hypothetical protein